MPVVPIERIADASGLREQVRAVRFGAGLAVAAHMGESLVGSPAAPGGVTDFLDVTVTGSAVVTTAAVQAAIAGQAIAPASIVTAGNATIGGKLIIGPDQIAPSTATTIGPATEPLLTFALADNSAAALDLRLIGLCLALPAVAIIRVDSLGLRVIAGSFDTLGSGGFSFPANELGLPIKLMPSWSAGTFTLSIVGPSATIMSLATDGGSGTLVTVSGGGGGLTADLDGSSVTLSGVVGAASGTNGTHTATYVSTSSFTITTGYTGYTSGGTVARTDNPTITWSGVPVVVVTPAP